MIRKAFFILTFLISFIAISAQVPRPELLYTKTGQVEPAFVIYLVPNWVSVGDYLGVYDSETMLCYGSKARITDTNNVVQMPGFLDEAMTTKIDGFKYGEQMMPFYYDYKADKFYSLSGIFYSYKDVKAISTKSEGKRIVSIESGTPIEPYTIKAMSLAIYMMDGLVKGSEIQLATNPDLSKVGLSFEKKNISVKSGGVDKVKLIYNSQNVSNIQLIQASGNGVINDGYYIYAPTDKSVIINIVGVNDFTGQILTDQMIITFDQGISSNAVFEDENIVIFLKGNQVWLKVKAEKLSGFIWRNDNGTWKKMYSIGSKLQGFETAFITGNYSRSWKGQQARVEYYYYVNGKMVSRTSTIKSFTL
jgi:hypothetical protein